MNLRFVKPCMISVLTPSFAALIMMCSQLAAREPVIDPGVWKITYPTQSAKGNPYEIKNPDFSSLVKSPEKFPEELTQYFYESKEGLVFHAEYTGITTSSKTKYSRTELREMKGGEGHNWTLRQGGELSCRLKITGLEGDAKRLFFMQIHAKSPESKPLLKCIWEMGHIRLLTKSGPALTDVEKKMGYANIPVDQWFTCTIKADSKAVEVLIDGRIVETYTAEDVLKFWPSDNTYYFKAGNYLQHNTAGAKSTVVFSEIKVSHP